MMIKPNYKNGSVINLMSTIKKSLGGTHDYNPLEDFKISNNNNIVLLVIDGLGYQYLKKYGKDTFLYKNLQKKITSVFPATTAAALTTLSTGLAPQQHGLTGWYMYLKEIGTISAILPFTTRVGGFRLSGSSVEYKDIYNEESFFENLEVSCITIKHKDYINSDYSLLIDKGAEQLPYSDIDEFFIQIIKGIEMNKGRKYVFAYWPVFDGLCHERGTESIEAKKHLFELDERIQKLSEQLSKKDTTIIVTADHGLIDSKEDKEIIRLEEHPLFTETLTMPLSGEPRVAYCYIKPSKTKQFEDYVNTKFKDICSMYKAEELIEENYYGLFEPNKKLKDRIGDYILIMKDNYIMKDFVLGEKKNIYIGNHGGMSEQEMYVPLIVID